MGVANVYNVYDDNMANQKTYGKDATMIWRDVPRWTYYEKYERVRVKNDFGWYEVYQLSGNVYAITEPQHFQGVNFYLILGSEKAVLMDTGLGILPLTPLIEELYQGEIIAVNSHFHFDHIGNNHAFQPVYNFTDEYVRRVANMGLYRADVGDQVDEEMFKNGWPEGFDADAFAVLPYSYIPLEDGQEFNLGDRVLKVIHTPGHSHDGIMLYDEVCKILFTGDTFYMGALYAHFNCDQFGRSDIREYYETMTRLRRMIPESVKLYCSHGDFIAPASKLAETADILSAIINGETKATGCVDKGHQYLEDGINLGELTGDGFSVVYVAEKEE